MKLKHLLIICGLLMVVYLIYRYVSRSSFNPNEKFTIGQPIDSFNGVVVYYNGLVGHTGGRNVSEDGYNIGMKFQCVEFVKRYYYERLNHKMPDSYGNAKDFFDAQLPDSSYNRKRDLLQFTNGSITRPQNEDLLVFDKHFGNPYGHVAIVCYSNDSIIALIQQNPGPFGPSRDTLPLSYQDNKWTIGKKKILGWLRLDSLVSSSDSTAPSQNYTHK